MAKHFSIPQGETFIPGYYYSVGPLTESNMVANRGPYIGTVQGNHRANMEYRYIYYCPSENDKPIMVDFYAIPNKGSVYLVSTEYNVLGRYGNNVAVSIPAGRLGIYRWQNNKLVLDTWSGYFQANFTGDSITWTNKNNVDVRARDAAGKCNQLFGHKIESSFEGEDDVMGASSNHDWPEDTSTESARTIIQAFNDLSKNYVYLWEVPDWVLSPGAPTTIPTWDASYNLSNESAAAKHQYGIVNGNWSRQTLGAASAKFNQFWTDYRSHVEVSKSCLFLCNHDDSTTETDNPTQFPLLKKKNETDDNDGLTAHLKSLCVTGKMIPGRRDSWSADKGKCHIFWENPNAGSDWPWTSPSNFDGSIQAHADSLQAFRDQYFNGLHPGTWISPKLVKWFWMYIFGNYIHADANGEAPISKYSDDIGWATTYTTGYGRAENGSFLEFAFNSQPTSAKEETRDAAVQWNIERLNFHMHGPGQAIAINGAIDGDFVIDGSIKMAIKQIVNNGIYAYHYHHEGDTMSPKYYLPSVEIISYNVEIRQLGTDKKWMIVFDRPSPSDDDRKKNIYYDDAYLQAQNKLWAMAIQYDAAGNVVWSNLDGSNINAGNGTLPPGAEILPGFVE